MSHVTSYRTRGFGHKLHQERVRSLTERMVRHWNKLPKEIVELPVDEMLKKCVDVALENEA